jgi:hypothetical protein
MDVRVGRLLEAGLSLKAMAESWVFGARAAAPLVAVDAGGWIGRDFDFIAFDADSGELLGCGSKAVFALQNADDHSPSSAIEILHAGILGRGIWERKMTLEVARPVVDWFFDLG